MSRVRRVTFIVGSNIRRFESGMKKVEQRMHRVGRQATFMGRDLQRSITMPVIAAGAGMLKLASDTGKYADELLDLQEVSGLTTDQLQEWRQVARVAGVETDAMSNAASGLVRRMKQLQEGSGAAHRAAQRLGLSVHDANGELRSTDEIMMDAVRSLGDMEAGLDRAGIANDLFGRRWEQIAPIIGMGADEIAKARQEAHDFGFVMDEEALEAANNFRDAMDQLQERIKVTGRNLALEFMPVIEKELIPMVDDLIGKFSETVRVFTDLDEETQIARMRMAALAAAMGPVLILAGSLITAFSKILGLLRVMLITNPWIAISIGIAEVTRRTISANNSLNEMREHLREIGNDLNSAELNREIASVQDKIDGWFSIMGSRVFITPQQRDRFNELNEELERLIRLRDQAAADELDGIISSESVDETTEAINRLTSSADHLKFQMEEPIQAVFTPDELREQEELLRGMAMHIDDIVDSMEAEGPDFTHRLAPPGSIRDLRERMGELREEMEMTSDPTKIQQFSIEIEVLQERIRALTDTTNDNADAFDDNTTSLTEFGNLGVQIFDRMVFQGEKLSSTLKSIGRQLATRGIMTLLTGGFGASAGGFMGGIRSIFGVNDAIISPKGDVITTHPDDYLIATKDPAGMANNVRDGGGGSGFKRPIVINLDGREVWRNQENLAYKRGQ